MAEEQRRERAPSDLLGLDEQEHQGEEQGGRRVADGDWYHAIEQIVLNNDDRSRLAHRARHWAESERIEAHVDQWERTFEQAIERTRSRALR